MDRFIYFDLGNVLVHFDHETGIRALAHSAGCSTQTVREVVFDSGLQDQYETGLVSNGDFAAQINARLGTDLSEAQVLEPLCAIFKPNLEILPILEWLHERETPMAILSNTCPGHWHWIVQQAWPVVGDWFRFTVLSYEVRSMKPDAQIYAHCEHRAQRQGASLFFTDDRAENLAAAENRGWKTHLFRSAAQLKPALEHWLDN